jgi:hypothetical protein
MAQMTQKVEKLSRISLRDYVNIRAKVEFVLENKRFASNLVANLPGVEKQTDDTSLNLVLKVNRLPEIERITHSLQRVHEITAVAYLLWPSKGISRKITSDTVKIINQVCKKKFSFINGKSFRCVVGGLFYLLGFRYDCPKKQKEIAIALQITDVSIRSFYKQWLKEFPEMFQDVIKKLPDPKLHRCYPNKNECS